MNASSLRIELAVERLRRPRHFFDAAQATARFAAAVGVVACSLGISAALAASNEPLVDKHDFLNSPTSVGSESAMDPLEDLFWMCDYAASVGDLDAGHADQCGVVTAHLKGVRFNGDSDAFEAWLRLNRAMAHGQLTAGTSTASCKQPASQNEARS